MGGSGSPDGAVIRFEVLSIEGDEVTIKVHGDKAEYFEVGTEYEAGVKEKHS